MENNFKKVKKVLVEKGVLLVEYLELLKDMRDSLKMINRDASNLNFYFDHSSGILNKEYNASLEIQVKVLISEVSQLVMEDPETKLCPPDLRAHVHGLVIMFNKCVEKD